MWGASNPYTSGSDGSKQRPSGLGEKIKGNAGANAGDRSSIAVERPLRLISRAVGSRILIKKDIPGRAGADRPSKQQLLKMNKCGCQSVSVRTAGGRSGRGGTDAVSPAHWFAWTGAGSQRSPESEGRAGCFSPTAQRGEGGVRDPLPSFHRPRRVAGCPPGAACPPQTPPRARRPPPTAANGFQRKKG